MGIFSDLFGGGGSNSTQSEVNKVETTTTTTIGGDIGFTGGDAINLAALGAQVANNLTTSAAGILSRQSRDVNATAQAAIQAGVDSTKGIAGVGKQIAGLASKFVSKGDNSDELVKIAGIAVVGIVVAIIFTRGS